jgi:hypothetical protein
MATQPKPQRGNRSRPATTQPAPRPPDPSRPSTGPDPHVAIRTKWARRLAAAGRWAVAAASGETGRRLARAIALTAVLAVLVTVLYDQGEVPRAAAAPAVDEPAGAARGHTVRGQDPGDHGGLRGRPRPAPVGERPAEVAAAWYAARHGAARSKVKALQQDRLSAREVRVLVLADLGPGRLRTALVRVRRGPDGWRVR